MQSNPLIRSFGYQVSGKVSQELFTKVSVSELGGHESISLQPAPSSHQGALPAGNSTSTSFESN